MASISCYVNTLPVTTAADQIGTETEHSGREKVRCPKSYVRCTGLWSILLYQVSAAKGFAVSRKRGRGMVLKTGAARFFNA